MRDLNANALAKIATTKGIEPIVIIDVDWFDNIFRYADKKIDTIPGKILDVSDFDAIVNVDGSSNTQEVRFTLDDTDGTIKSIMDNHDVHLRDVWIYQWFEGLVLADRFLLFQGKINSPVIWDESKRTVHFSVITNLEGNEIGYSTETNLFEGMLDSAIDQPWPLCFGTTTHVKALRLTERVMGTLGDGLSFQDFALVTRGEITRYIATRPPDYYLGAYLGDTAAWDAYIVRLTETAAGDSEKIQATLANQPPLDISPKIIGGENLPQGEDMYVKIGNTTFYGRMVDDVFTFADFNQHPNVGDFHTGIAITDLDEQRIISDNKTYSVKTLPYEDETVFQVVRRSAETDEITGWTQGTYLNGKIKGDNAGYISIQPGARISLITLEPQVYVVSLVPGTVTKVTAWAEKDGERFLQDIDSDDYTVSTDTYAGLTVTFITLHDALSKTIDFTWSDEIFVTFVSNIGPNTVDILQYLIETYSDFTIDAATFAAVKAKVTNPSNFTIYDRKELFAALREIAWQARCAIWLKNDVFFIKYLDEEPTPIATITESDIEINSLTLEHTPTEDLITKVVCEWRESDAQDDPYKVILRENIDKYGTHEKTYDFYIYDAAAYVQESAQFWITRYANTWKKLKMNVPLTLLAIETFDAVTLDFTDNYVASGDVIATVETALYDSSTNTIALECWCPIKAGTMV